MQIQTTATLIVSETEACIIRNALTSYITNSPGLALEVRNTIDAMYYQLRDKFGE